MRGSGHGTLIPGPAEALLHTQRRLPAEKNHVLFNIDDQVLKKEILPRLPSDVTIEKTKKKRRERPKKRADADAI